MARATTGPAGDRRRLAPATRKRRLIALRSFLRFCQREEWLRSDLASTVDLPRLPERLPKPLEDDARERLVAALTASTPAEMRDRAFILLLLSSGARISEILRLDRSDWGRERLTLRGKGDRERTAMVTDRARRAVDAYLAARQDPSPALFIGLRPAAVKVAHNRLTPAGARHVCRHLALGLGIPAFHPHQLRHTLGTLLQEELGDARVTAETLGHVGLASVAGYTKITDRRRREALEVLEGTGAVARLGTARLPRNRSQTRWASLRGSDRGHRLAGGTVRSLRSWTTVAARAATGITPGPRAVLRSRA